MFSRPAINLLSKHRWKLNIKLPISSKQNTSGHGNATQYNFQYQVLTNENLTAPVLFSSVAALSRIIQNWPHLYLCPERLDRVSRKDTELENYSLTFIVEPWEQAQRPWSIKLPEAGPFSLPLKRLCWGLPVAFFHIPHSAPCPLPRHSPPGETSPHPSPVPLPNPCNYQTPT